MFNAMIAVAADKIKNVCLVYRPYSPKAAATAKKVALWLKKRDLELYTHPELKVLAKTKRIKPNEIKNLDLVIVLGGDGTFLRAVRMLNSQQTPILGVNLGNLGFLTEIRVEELFKVLEMTLENKMERVERSTLYATVVRKNGKKDSFNALNDIVVERGENSRLINMAVYAGSFLVSTVKADGLIIATPTGSTAYCLAAGGPIVQPGVRAVTITPICPHTLTNRPVILCEDEKIKLKLTANPGKKAVLMIDGQRQEDLAYDDTVLITKGKKPVVMLSLPTRNYFDILRSKLRFGERE